MCFLIFIFYVYSCGASNNNIFVFISFIAENSFLFARVKALNCLNRLKGQKDNHVLSNTHMLACRPVHLFQSGKGKDKQIRMKRTVTVTVTLRPGCVGPTRYSGLMLIATNQRPCNRGAQRTKFVYLSRITRCPRYATSLIGSSTSVSRTYPPAKGLHRATRSVSTSSSDFLSFVPVGIVRAFFSRWTIDATAVLLREIRKSIFSFLNSKFSSSSSMTLLRQTLWAYYKYVDKKVKKKRKTKRKRVLFFLEFKWRN